MIKISLKLLTLIVFLATILINIVFGVLSSVSALFTTMFASSDNNIDWFAFLISPYGAQTVSHILVVASLYFAIQVLPEKCLPELVNSALSIPLIVAAFICFASFFIQSAVVGFNLLFVFNIIAGLVCLFWVYYALQGRE